MTQPIYKRTRKLINKKLQLKMVGVFAAIGCVSALFQIVLINSSLLDIARNAPAGGEEILRQSRPMMMENVLWTIGALIPLMTCVGIVITHRVAGPAYRMTEHLKAIAAGGPVQSCRIREGDELVELCDALNAALAHLAPANEASEELTEEWNLESTPSLVRSAQTAESTPAEPAEPAEPADVNGRATA